MNVMTSIEFPILHTKNAQMLSIDVLNSFAVFIHVMSFRQL